MMMMMMMTRSVCSLPPDHQRRKQGESFLPQSSLSARSRSFSSETLKLSFDSSRGFISLSLFSLHREPLTFSWFRFIVGFCLESCVAEEQQLAGSSRPACLVSARQTLPDLLLLLLSQQLRPSFSPLSGGAAPSTGRHKTSFVESLRPRLSTTAERSWPSTWRQTTLKLPEVNICVFFFSIFSYLQLHIFIFIYILETPLTISLSVYLIYKKQLS